MMHFCNLVGSSVPSVSRIAKELPSDPIGDHEISADRHGEKREVLVMSVLVPREGDTTCCFCSRKESAEKEGVGAYRQEQRGGDEEDVPEM